jgi:predicted amidohydrolase YtcJ
MTGEGIGFLNANVLTLNHNRPRAEAIAVRDDKIVYVGSNSEIRGYTDKHTKIIDCKGKTIVPGLVDCHVHLLEYGLFLQQLNLRNATSIKEVQQKLRQYAEQNEKLEWILGGRWDQEKFSEKRYPIRWDLDAAIPDKPVYLTRVCGHLAVANSKALRLARITKKTKVKGGAVDLEDTTGEPNGIVRENAMDLVLKAIPKHRREQLEKACSSACQKAVEAGLTGVHWLVASTEELQFLQKMHLEGNLPIRVYLGVPVRMLERTIGLGLQTGFGNDMLRVGFIKILADGSLGASTAALKEPYSDNPRKRGMMLYGQEELCQLVSKAHDAGLQLGIHAIGDRAIENVLNAFEKAVKKSPQHDRRHRIEHCSILNPRLIKRMKRLGIVASVQPHFIISDFWMTERVGEKRARWAYPFKTLLKEDIVVASGSDCPIEEINPLLGIWASVAREDNREQRLTAEEALRTYTVNAAYASFDEKKKGTIEPGKYADLTILSDDPAESKPEKIRDITVEMVMVDGRIVYSRELPSD